MHDSPEIRRDLGGGRRLNLVRAAAISVAALYLLVFFLALPSHWDILQTTSQMATRVLSDLGLGGRQPPQFWFSLVANYPSMTLGFEILVLSLFTIAAGLIFRYRSDDWLVMMVAVGMLAYSLYILPALDDLMVANPAWQYPGNLLQAAGIALALLFFYLFSDGHFAPRWTRWLILIWVAWSVLWVAFPNSIFNFADPFALSIPAFLLLLLWWFSGVFAQAYRYRGLKDPAQRQQTKYVFFGVTFAVIAYGLYVPTRELLARFFPNSPAAFAFSLFGEAGFLIVVSLVPISFTLSILRYRLWDIDFFIRRTLIYSAVTATLAVIYFAIVYLFSGIFGEMIGTSSQTVRVIAIFLIAILFNPLRQRIQRDIDRLFYRQRYNAEQVLAEFGERLGSEVDLDEIRADLLNVVAEVLQPQSVSLWLVKPPAQSEVQADQEAPADEILI